MQLATWQQATGNNISIWGEKIVDAGDASGYAHVGFEMFARLCKRLCIALCAVLLLLLRARDLMVMIRAAASDDELSFLSIPQSRI